MPGYPPHVDLLAWVTSSTRLADTSSAPSARRRKKEAFAKGAAGHTRMRVGSSFVSEPDCTRGGQGDDCREE